VDLASYNQELMKSVLQRGFVATACLVVLLFTISAWSAKNFVMPTPQAAKTYPANDAHTDESVTVALDPYDKPEKTSPVFSVKYLEVGYLPIFMVITNDGDEAVSLAGMKGQLVTADKTKLSPANEDDLYRRLSHPNRKSNTYPLPFPTSKGVKGAIGKQALDEIQNAHFAARAVEPHSTQAGFLFFEISDVAQPLAGAQFYLTGVRDSKGNELMYFEVPLEKYLNAAKP
jgi:hypothetical protein